MPSTTRCAVLSKNVISQGSQRFFCQMFPLKKKLAAVFHQCRFQTSCSLQTAQHCLRPGTTFKTAVCSALYSLTYKRQCFSFTHRCFASASKRLGVSKPPAAVCGGSDAKACSVAQIYHQSENYETFWSEDQVELGKALGAVMSGTLKAGRLRTFVIVEDSKQKNLPLRLRIPDHLSKNRALHGDIVSVCLDPRVTSDNVFQYLEGAKPLSETLSETTRTFSKCRVVHIQQRAEKNINDGVLCYLMPQVKQKRSETLLCFAPVKNRLGVPGFVVDDPNKDCISRYLASHTLNQRRLKKTQRRYFVLQPVLEEWTESSFYTPARFVESSKLSFLTKTPGHFFEVSTLCLNEANLVWRPWEAVSQLECFTAKSEATATEEDTENAPKWLTEALQDKHRTDLRHLEIMTIDPSETTDIDDAIHFELPKNGSLGSRIGIHIADVSHFVLSGTRLDAEARRRGCTTYHFSRILPMLPEVLSSNICSLKPNEDRLAISVLFTINEEGALATTPAPEIVKSVIRSRQKLNYGQVTDYFENAQGPHGIHDALTQQLDQLLQITQKMRERQKAEDRLIMNMQPHFVFKTSPAALDGWPDVLEPAPDRREAAAHFLIEELMIVTNQIVARRLWDMWCFHNIESILRRHHNPAAGIRKKLLQYLQGLPGVPKDDLSSQSLPELLRTLERKCPNHTLIVATQWVTEDLVAAEYVSVSDAPESEAKTRNQTHNTKLNLLSALTSGDAVAGASCDNCTGATKFDLETPEALPRGAGGSIVSSDTFRHDALSLPIYTHFTSPIRRYIDLRIHQLLSTQLLQAASNTAPHNMTDTVNEVLEVCQECNDIFRAHRKIMFHLTRRVFNNYLQQHYPNGYALDRPVVVSLALPSVVQETQQVNPRKNQTSSKHRSSSTAYPSSPFCTIALFVREINLTQYIPSSYLGKIVDSTPGHLPKTLKSCQIVNGSVSASFTAGDVTRLIVTPGTEYMHFSLPQ